MATLPDAGDEENYDRSALFPLPERKRRSRQQDWALASVIDRRANRMFEAAVPMVNTAFANMSPPHTYRDAAPHLINMKWILGEFGTEAAETALVRLISELARQGIIVAEAPFMRGHAWFTMIGQEGALRTHDSVFGAEVDGSYLRLRHRAWSDRRLAYLLHQFDLQYDWATKNNEVAHLKHITIGCTEDDQMLLGEFNRQLVRRSQPYEAEMDCEMRRCFNTDDDMVFFFVLELKSAVAGQTPPPIPRNLHRNRDWKYRILMHSSIDWRDPVLINSVLAPYSPLDTLIICRSCSYGAGGLIGEAARRRGFNMREYSIPPEEWETHGSNSRLRVSAAMVEQCQLTNCFLFITEQTIPDCVEIIISACSQNGVKCHKYYSRRK